MNCVDEKKGMRKGGEEDGQQKSNSGMMRRMRRRNVRKEGIKCGGETEEQLNNNRLNIYVVCQQIGKLSSSRCISKSTGIPS